MKTIMENSKLTIKALMGIRKTTKVEAICWLVVVCINIAAAIAALVCGFYHAAYLHLVFAIIVGYIAHCCKRYMESIDIIIECIAFNDECKVKYDNLYEITKDYASRVGRAAGVLTMAKVFIKNSDTPLTNAKAGLLEQIDECLAVPKNAAEQMAEQVVNDIKNEREQSHEA